MPSIDKVFSFLSDAEGLARVGSSANIAFAWEGGDGVPAGCVKFTEPSGHPTPQIEKARQSTSQTWESWGLPPGAVVSQVELISGSRNNLSVAGQTGFLKARVVTAAGVSVHSAGDLCVTSAGVIGWNALDGLQGGRGVDPSYVASNTAVCLELEMNGSTQGGTIDTRLDTLVVRITYTGGSGSPTNPSDPTTGPTAPPNGGIYLSDGTYIPGSEVCGAGVADKFTLVTWMRDGHQ